MSLPKIFNLPRYRRSAAVAALAVSMVCGFEGLRTVAYIDPVGIPTIYFGETKGVRLGDTATIGCVAVRLPGLTARRAEERAMCLIGVYGAPA